MKKAKKGKIFPKMFHISTLYQKIPGSSTVKDMRTLRKADIPAGGVALAWTGIFLAVLLVLFCLDGAAPPTVERLKAERPAAAVKTENTPVELNTAGKEELMALPGIGETLAEAIIDHRKTHGPFRTPEELMNVPGIGEKRFEALRGKITANGKGTT